MASTILLAHKSHNSNHIQRQSQQTSNSTKLRIVAERAYAKIYDKNASRFTEEGLDLLKLANISPDKVLIRLWDTFKSDFDHEEIAKVHFNHYKMKRIKYLNKLDSLIREREALHHLSLPQMLPMTNDYQDTAASKSGTGTNFMTSLHHSVRQHHRHPISSLDKLKPLNQSADVLPYTTTQQHLQSSKGHGGTMLIEDAAASKVAAYQSRNNNNSHQYQGGSGGEEPLFATEVVMQESPEVNRRQNKKKAKTALGYQNYTMSVSTLRSQIHPQSSLLHPLILSSDYTPPLHRYMRARDLAEQKAKEKIERLNTLIDKWDQKEKRIKELQLESLELKKWHADKNRQKLEQARDKHEKQLKVLEDRGAREYQAYLQELKRKKAEELRRTQETSMKDFLRNNAMINTSSHERSKILRNQGSVSHRSQDLERTMSDTTLKLESFQRKIARAQDRSLMLNKKATLQNTLQQQSRYSSVQKLQEETLISKLSKYLEKMKKHDKAMLSKLEYTRYQQEAARHKSEQKALNCSQIKHEYEKDLDRKRKQIMVEEQQKDESLGQHRYDTEINIMKKSEQAKLKMEDLREQYEEVLAQQKLRKEKIRVKHEAMDRQITILKGNERMINEMRMRQAEERRRFMENKKYPSPYEEMKIKYLKTNDAGSQNRNGKKGGGSMESQSLETQQSGIASSGQL